MAIRLSNEVFIERLGAVNNMVLPLEHYKGMQVNIQCKCLQCNNVWPARPGHLLEGHGCPVCKGGVKKSEEDFLEQLKLLNPLIHPKGKYVNARTKILCYCDNCHQTFQAVPDKLLQGAGCSICDSRYKSSFPEQALYFYICKAFPDAVNRFIISEQHIELDIFVPKLHLGIEYDGIYWHKHKSEYEKKKYDICKEHGLTLMRIRESDDDVQGVADITLVRKKPYYSFETLDNVILECMKKLGSQIKVNTYEDSAAIRLQYFSIRRKNSLLSVYPNIAEEWNEERNKGITPDMVSAGTSDKFWWKCRVCGYEWYASVAGRTGRGRGCKSCAKRKASEKFKKRHSEYVRQLQEVNPNLEVLEEYKTTHEPLKTRCKVCGHIWEAAPANLLRGRKCPKCSKKTAAIKISETKKLRNVGRKQIGCKAVKQYDLSGNYIQTFESISQAKAVTGATKIGCVCNGQRIQSGGFIWKYEKQSHK